MSAAPAPLVEDNRLRPALRGAAAPVQALAAALARALDGREAERRLIAAIAEDHAMIADASLHAAPRAAARRIMAAEDRLRRLHRLLPPDPAVAARGGAGGPAAMAQP